jgi:tRNA A37 threonylcarbamoyladenosine dehydratase
VITRSDMNRQLFALSATLGQSKVQAAKEHIRQIDENILVHTYETFYGDETAAMFDLHAYDYVVDSLGTLSSKLLLIERAKACKTPILSCMDTANRLNPSRLEIADISRSTVCPVAREIRLQLRKKGIRKVKVLFSKELVIRRDKSQRGTVSYISGAAGCLVASEVVRDLLSKKSETS